MHPPCTRSHSINSLEHEVAQLSPRQLNSACSTSHITSLGAIFYAGRANGAVGFAQLPLPHSTPQHQGTAPRHVLRARPCTQHDGRAMGRRRTQVRVAMVESDIHHCLLTETRTTVVVCAPLRPCITSLDQWCTERMQLRWAQLVCASLFKVACFSAC
jgi:hypothetical protein